VRAINSEAEGGRLSTRESLPRSGERGGRPLDKAVVRSLPLMAHRLKALLVQTVFSAHGGAAGVAAWMVEALKTRYDLTLLTWAPADLDRINTTYGTSLKHDDVGWVFPNPIARHLVELIPDNTWDWQKRSWLMRVCKRIHQRYDVLLTGDAEFDFGRPGVQYVHYPWMGPSYVDMQEYGRVDGWRIVPALARRVYRPWMKTANFRFDTMLPNLTLVNSNWTAQEYRRFYGREAQTVYPPAAGQFPQTAWDERQDEFVAISRLEVDKNHDRIVAILKKVRQEHPQIKLHIVGTRLRSLKGGRDYRRLRALIDPEADWVILHEDMPRTALMELLGKIRYGIHLFEKEHFGMAIAEMTRGGLIPFVHDSGGQVEIVTHPALRFRTDEEAEASIGRILKDAGLRERVRGLLRESGRRFTPERFCAELLRWTELCQTSERSETANDYRGSVR
jgi:glycosyltransferase involved in cell wall biosynthesis